MHWIIEDVKPWLERSEMVNAFGIILYTARHANIAKVLADNDYWADLHERTGDRWPVFVMNRPAGALQFPASRPGDFALMVGHWKEPAANKQLLKDLKLDSTENAYLFVYSVLNDDEVLVHHITLNDESVASAHAGLREALDAATTAIDGIRKENFKLAEGVHAALDLTITSLKQRRVIKKAIPLFQILRKLFSHA